MGILQTLKNAGQLKLSVDYRAGHTLDTAGSNTETLTNTVLSKSEKGVAFIGNGSTQRYIDYGTSVNLDPKTGDFTVFALVRCDGAVSGSIYTILGKLSYTSGADEYGIAVNQNKFFIKVADGTNLASIAFDTTLNPGQTYFVLGERRSNVVRVYVNNVASTSTSSIVTGSIDSANPFRVGGANTVSPSQPWQGSIYAGGYISRVLTTTEMAQLSSEIQNIIWPTSSITKSTPTISASRNGLIIEELLDNVSGTNFPDTSPTAAAWTLTGSGATENGPLGKSFKFNGSTTRLDTSTTYSAITKTGNYTMSAWFKMNGTVGGVINIGNNISADRNGICIIPNNIIGGGYYNGTAYTGNDKQGVANLWYNMILVNTAGVVTTYLNGEAFTGNEVGSPFGNLGTSNTIGWNSNATFFNGPIKNVQVWNRSFSAAEARQVYEQGRFFVPFQTGFGSIQSTAAEGGVVGQFISNTPFQCADTTGRWQISTNTINGSLVKTIKNTTNGRLYLDMSKFGTATEASYGSWTFWINKPAAASMNFNIMNNTSTAETAGNNGYYVQFSVEGGGWNGIKLYKVANGVASAGFQKFAAFLSSTWIKATLTRTTTGSWSFYLNDTLLGSLNTGTNPFTENTYTSAQYLVFECLSAANIEIAYADLVGNYFINKGYFA